LAEGLLESIVVSGVGTVQLLHKGFQDSLSKRFSKANQELLS
jgi:hypothetical protein